MTAELKITGAWNLPSTPPWLYCGFTPIQMKANNWCMLRDPDAQQGFWVMGYNLTRAQDRKLGDIIVGLAHKYNEPKKSLFPEDKKARKIVRSQIKAFAKAANLTVLPMKDLPQPLKDFRRTFAARGEFIFALVRTPKAEM